jgi:hypothetical protein
MTEREERPTLKALTEQKLMTLISGEVKSFPETKIKLFCFRVGNEMNLKYFDKFYEFTLAHS